MAYYDIDPMDIDPETNRPYSNYSSDSLDTSFHDGEMNIDDPVDPTLEALKLAERALIGAYGEPVEGASMQSQTGVDAIRAVREQIAQAEGR